MRVLCALAILLCLASLGHHYLRWSVERGLLTIACVYVAIAPPLCLLVRRSRRG